MRKATTKDKLLHILKKNEELPLKDIMEYFSISEVAVRKQLNELIRRGLVIDTIEKQAIGRPVYKYKLSAEGHGTFPNQYDSLPQELLDDLVVAYGDEAVEKLLKERKAREQDEILQSFEANDFKNNIMKMIEYQESRGYMIDVSETIHGDIKIKNFNCPIFNLASHYNMICDNEHQMYLELFPKSKVLSEACLTKNENYCCWTITRPRDKDEKK